jgi:hypothetical protein
MENRIAEASGMSVSTLVGDIVTDAQNLLKQELALTKREMTEEIAKAKEAAISLAIGAGILAVGGVLLCFMLVYLLNWAFPDNLPLWGCFAIVGGAFAAAGAILLVVGAKRAGSIHLVPERTLNTMKDNVKWIKNPTSPENHRTK